MAKAEDCKSSIPGSSPGAASNGRLVGKCDVRSRLWCLGVVILFFLRFVLVLFGKIVIF